MNEYLKALVVSRLEELKRREDDLYEQLKQINKRSDIVKNRIVDTENEIRGLELFLQNEKEDK